MGAEPTPSEPTPSKVRSVDATKGLLAELRQIHANGEDLSDANMKQKHRSLERALSRRFGGWYKAVAAAGISPDSIYRQHPRRSKEDIIRQVQEWQRQGVDLSASNIERLDPKFYKVVAQRFGGHYKILEAAGIPPEKYHRYHASHPDRYWTKERIIEALQRRHATGADMSYLSIRKENSALDNATFTVFGGYYNALAAAGIDVEQYRKFRRGYWSKEKVVELLREFVSKYKTLDLLRDRDQFLAAAITREFGTMKAACAAADLDYVALTSRRRWTKEEVLQEIRLLYRMDEDLSGSSMRAHHNGLLLAALGKFGTWKNAVASAGFDYEKVRKDRWKESFLGREFEEYVGQTLRVLGRNVVHHQKHELGGEASVPDFVDRDSGTWIDAQLDAGSFRVYNTIRKYLLHTDLLVILYLKGWPRKDDAELAQFVPIKSYYKQLRANGADELVARIERLRKGRLRPDLQADLDRYAKKRMHEAA